jgi:GNAT superfamily N-acetyltransferase
MVLIRSATITDAEAIATVHVRSWQLAYLGQLPAEFLEGLSVESRADAWRQILSRESVSLQGLWVAEGSDGIVGFAHAAKSRDEDAGPSVGELTSIYVIPQSWGRGTGRLLMETVVDWLRDAGFAAATLWVLTHNERARRFYGAAGWQPDGAQKTDALDSFELQETRFRREL